MCIYDHFKSSQLSFTTRIAAMQQKKKSLENNKSAVVSRFANIEIHLQLGLAWLSAEQ